MLFAGINISHNSSAALLQNGFLKSAICSERLSRIKYFHESGDAQKALLRLLALNNYGSDDIRLMGSNFGDYLPMYANRDELGYMVNYALGKARIPMRLFPHHLSHAASAFFSSGFSEALVMVSDAAGSAYIKGNPVSWQDYEKGNRGKRECISFYKGKKGDLTLLEQFFFPNSLGEFYSLITAWLGFNRHGRFLDFNEGSTMGLAPYGKEHFRGESFISLNRDGFSFNPSLIAVRDGSLVPGPDFHDLLGPGRTPGDEFKPAHMLAAYIAQNDLEKAVVYLLELALYRYPCNKIALAGGTFHNSCLNGRVMETKGRENVYVFPAADDSGLAAGNAFLAQIFSEKGGLF